MNKIRFGSVKRAPFFRSHKMRYRLPNLMLWLKGNAIKIKFRYQWMNTQTYVQALDLAIIAGVLSASQPI